MSKVTLDIILAIALAVLPIVSRRRIVHSICVLLVVFIQVLLIQFGLSQVARNAKRPAQEIYRRTSGRMPRPASWSCPWSWLSLLDLTQLTLATALRPTGRPSFRGRFSASFFPHFFAHSSRQRSTSLLPRGLLLRSPYSETLFLSGISQCGLHSPGQCPRRIMPLHRTITTKW